MAGHVLLPDLVLPALADGQEDRTVLHGLPGIGCRGRAGVGGLPTDGRRRRALWLPVDVPDLWSPGHCAGRCLIVVVARPPAPSRTAPCADEAFYEVVPGLSRSPPRGRRRHPLRGSQASLPHAALDFQGPGLRSDRLEVVAVDAHVLWCRRGGHRNTALRHRHHLWHQPELYRRATESAICTHLDREWIRTVCSC